MWSRTAYFLYSSLSFLCSTEKTQYRKFEANVPRKGIARPQSNLPNSRVCERFIYSHNRSAYSAAGKYVGWSWEYINRSQIHECGHWDWGCAIPFLGTHKWDFRCTEYLLPHALTSQNNTASPLFCNYILYFHEARTVQCACRII